MRNKYLFCIATLGLSSLGFAQTVTVDPTLVAPNNTSTFSSLQLAIHSFQASGAVKPSTDASGVGVNHGNVAPDVINIVNTSTIDELVRIDERAASGGYTVLDEDLTIAGPGNGAAPSAVNNAVVAVQDDGANDDDGFEIRSDVDITVKNVSFIPSPTLPPGDDLVTVDRLTASNGTPSSVTFESCVFTVYNSANLPVVNSKAEALVDQSANVTTPASAVDDLFDPFPDSGEGMIISLVDCVLGQTKALGGSKDGVVEVAGGTAGRGDQFTFNVESSIISYCARYGIQFAGYGDPADSSLWIANLAGSNIGAGPVVGEGGPTVLLGNLRGIQSFLGPNHGKLNVNNTIVANNVERQLSLDNDTETSFSRSIIQGAVPVVTEFEGGAQPSANALWEDITIRAVASSTLFGTGGGSGATLTIRDSIFAGDGTVDAAIGTFGLTPDMQIDVDYSAIVTAGPNAVLAVGGTTATTIGPNVINSDPEFVGTDPLLPTFLDVASCDYVDKAQDGSDLSGGADFVGVCSSVGNWSMY